MKQTVLTMTMIRSVVDDSLLSMIPNELLFEIFSMLEPPERKVALEQQQVPQTTGWQAPSIECPVF